MNTYQLDTLVELQTTFTDADGALVNPTTVTLYIRTPDGIVTAYTGGNIGHPSTGLYTFDVNANQSGPWIYKWQGTGAVEITSPDVYFQVEQSAALAG